MDIWSILIIILLAQGVFNISLLGVFYVRKREASKLNLFFISLLLLWFLLEFLSVRQAFKIPLNSFYGTRYGSWFLLGPLTLFFFQSITEKQWKFTWKKWIQLMPFLVITLVVPFISNESLSYRQIHYGMLSVFDYRPKTVTVFEYFYSTVFYLQFVHLAAYLTLNSILIRKYSKALKEQYSSVKNLVWISSFNYLLIGVLSLVSSYLYILFESDLYSRELDYIYVLPIGLFIYAISYKLASQEWLPITLKTAKANSRFSSEEKQHSIKVLESHMREDRPYLINDLRLKDLAESIQLTPHQLSHLINDHYQCSFFDLINKHRVEEAKNLISLKPSSTLLEIAFESGFNNKTSFVNAFKKFNGTTPSAFKKQL